MRYQVSTWFADSAAQCIQAIDESEYRRIRDGNFIYVYSRRPLVGRRRRRGKGNQHTPAGSGRRGAKA
jgi:hypothetical protein